MLKTIFKLFIICVLLAAVVIGSVALYMKFYGHSLLEKTLSGIIGSTVKIKTISINMDKYMVSFGGFRILNEIDFEKNVLDAEKFTIVLNREKFEKEKKIIFDEVIIKRGILNIERDRSGSLSVSYPVLAKGDEKLNIGKAAEPAAASGLYAIAENVRQITIEGLTVNFKDNAISKDPFKIRVDNVYLKISSRDKATPGALSIPVKCDLDFEIPNTHYGRGRFILRTSMAVYKDRVDMEMTVDARNIDCMQFVPYLDKYTPFYFNDGVFDSASDFRMHNNSIDSLTTMMFRKLNIAVNPNKENALFLEISVNKLFPYLMSRSGEVLFDFVIVGPASKPYFGVGPQVRYAIGVVVVEEMSKMIQRVQKFRQFAP